LRENENSPTDSDKSHLMKIYPTDNTFAIYAFDSMQPASIRWYEPWAGRLAEAKFDLPKEVD
jgi:hypothetical protein